MHLSGEAKSRAQSLETKGDSWRESSREKSDKAPASLDSVQWCCVTVAEYVREPNSGKMGNGSLLGVVCNDEDARRDQKNTRES